MCMSLSTSPQQKFKDVQQTTCGAALENHPLEWYKGQAGGPRREHDFPELWPEEILFAASLNLKLEHTFYQMRERVQRLSKDQKLSCSDIRALGNTNKPDNSLHAQYLMFARCETLYSLRCKKRDVYLAADWDTKAYY